MASGYHSLIISACWSRGARSEVPETFNVQSYLEGMGYACTQYPFSDTNDMASVVQNAADNSDVLYVPTDNTAANNTGIDGKSLPRCFFTRYEPYSATIAS